MFTLCLMYFSGKHFLSCVFSTRWINIDSLNFNLKNAIKLFDMRLFDAMLYGMKFIAYYYCGTKNPTFSRIDQNNYLFIALFIETIVQMITTFNELRVYHLQLVICAVERCICDVQLQNTINR